MITALLRRALRFVFVALLATAPPAAAQTAFWVGGAAPDNHWSTATNWLDSQPPVNGGVVAFNSGSAQNLSTNNDIAALSLAGIVVVNPAGAVSIGGNGVTLGSGGIDLSTATQSLTLSLGTGQTITLGAGQTWKLGSAGTGSGQTITVNSPIAGDATAGLTYGLTNQTSGTSGTVQLLAANTYAGNTTLGGPNATYEIGTDTPFGVGGTVNVNSFNSAPRIRTLNGARTIANPLTWNSGFMLTADSAGDLTLNGPVVFTGDVTGQTNRTLNNASSSLTVTVNGTITAGDPTITPTVHNRTLTLTSVTGGSIVVNGVIADPTSATNTDNGGLTKNGTGPATLSNVANTYTGQTVIQNGTLEVTMLADAGLPSSIGTGGANGQINLGATTTTGGLRYVGTTNASTNRVLSLAGTTGGGVLDSSGSGTVTFTANFAAGGAASKTLTLTGTNTGANTIAGIIRDNSAANKTSLVKSGAGTWSLTGANTFTGGTTITGGTLVINADNRLGAAPAAPPTAGAIVLNGGALQAAATFTLSANRGIALGPASGAGGGTIDVTGGSVLTYTGVIANNGGGTGGLTKAGAGTLSLSGAHTYSGDTAVTAGTLVLGGSIANSSGVVVTGGTLQITADHNFKALDVQKSLPGLQSFDLNNHSIKIFATNLAAAQTSTASQVVDVGGDGIYDSTNAANTAVGYAVVNNSYVLVKKTLLGDATMDGAVDFNDLVVLAQHYNASAGNLWPDGDFTRDGAVNFSDLVPLAQNYNTTLPAGAIRGAPVGFEQDLAAAFATVPEPSGALLIAGAILQLQRRRRRHGAR
jgi:autotransporter-associated beta strand protein